MLRATFRRLDADNSGFITAENLKGVLGDNFDGINVGDLLKEADLDGNGKISYTEFSRFLTESMDSKDNGEPGTPRRTSTLADRIIDRNVEKKQRMHLTAR